MRRYFVHLRRLFVTLYALVAFYSSISLGVEDTRLSVPQPATGHAVNQGAVLPIQFVCNNPYIRRIEIDLMSGPSYNAGLVMRITDAALPCQKMWQWRVPKSANPASDYFIRLSGINRDGKIADYGYSGRFSIRPGDGAGAWRPIEQASCIMDAEPTKTSKPADPKLTSSTSTSSTQNRTSTSTSVISSTTTEIVLETPVSNQSSVLSLLVINCAVLLMPLILYL